MNKWLIIVVLSLLSCKSNDIKFELKYSDDFEKTTLNKEWTKETATKQSLEIVSDPLNKKNKVLKLKLNLGDVSGKGRYSNGYRCEVVYSPKDTINTVVKYQFKFLFLESFFKKGEKQGWIMIHQWHDNPALGYTWSDCKGTNPPYNLYVQHNANGDYFLKFTRGLRIGNIDERTTITYKDKLIPNHWYTFENEIKWHVYSDKSYCIPKLGQYFSDKKEKIYQRNMYNQIPNYFKMGLYWSGIEKI